jgi:DNA-binding LacI/PurR family transcriptional regulator
LGHLYQPDQVVRSLRAKRTMTVGMIISDISNPFCADVVRGVEEVLSVTVDPDLIQSSQSTVEGGAAAARTLLDLTPNALSQGPH